MSLYNTKHMRPRLGYRIPTPFRYYLEPTHPVYINYGTKLLEEVVVDDCGQLPY